MDALAETASAVQWVDDVAAFRKLEAAWNSLVDRCGGATPFQRHEWICAAYAHQSRRRPCAGLLWRDERLVAALPLDVGWDRHGGLPVRTARVAGYPRTDRHVFLAEDATAVAPLLDAAMALPVDMVLLSEAWDCETVSGVLRTWLAYRGTPALSRRASVARRVALTADTSDDLYASYSANLRSNVRRSRRRLEELGRLDIEILRPSPEATKTLLGRLKIVEDEAWQGEQGSGLFSTAESLALYMDVLGAFAANSDLWIGVMRIDDEDTMYILGFTHGETFYWYSTAHRPGRIKGAAFHVLTHDLMIALRRVGLACFDGSRNTPDRQNPLDRLHPELVEHRHFALFRPTPLGFCQRLAFAWILPLYRRIRAILSPSASQAAASPWRREPQAAAPSQDASDGFNMSE